MILDREIIQIDSFGVKCDCAFDKNTPVLAHQTAKFELSGQFCLGPWGVSK